MNEYRIKFKNGVQDSESSYARISSLYRVLNDPEEEKFIKGEHVKKTNKEK